MEVAYRQIRLSLISVALNGICGFNVPMHKTGAFAD